MSDNFYVLKAYNESDVYALWVGEVADRAGTGGRIVGRWSDLRGITRRDLQQLQQRLEAMGHDVGSADGLVGFRTRVAIGRWQEQHGRPPTCFPDVDVIDALR